MALKFFENDQERQAALSKLRYDVAKAIKIKPNSSILDVLVGYGDFTRAIAKTYNAKVTAIELIDVDIEEAKSSMQKSPSTVCC